MSTSRPRVLVVAPRFPLPLRSGTQLREYHVLRGLADLADVTLVSLVQSEDAADHVAAVEELGVEVRTVPHDMDRRNALLRFATSRRPYRACKFATTALRQELRETPTDEIDLIWANFYETATAVPPDVGIPLVVDTHNAAVDYWRTYGSGDVATRAFAALNIRRLHRTLEALGSRTDGVVAVSDADVNAAAAWAEGEPAWVLPNGVDVDRFSPSGPAADAGESVVFVGSLDVRMNEEAVEWFVEHAWPDVRDRRSDAQFRIVGRSPSRTVRSLDAEPGVHVVGEVDSVVPYYDEAAVAVAPFAHGGGSKLKVLEALAMARPVVTTPTGATGIDLEADQHALVVERPAFADAVVDLLAEPSRRTALGRAGRTLVERAYDWETVTDQVVADVLRTVVPRDIETL